MMPERSLATGPNSATSDTPPPRAARPKRRSTIAPSGASSTAAGATTTTRSPDGADPAPPPLLPGTSLILRVPGSPPTKANSYRYVGSHGRPRLVKTRAVTAYEDAVAMHAIALRQRLGLSSPVFTEPVRLVICYHQGDRRRRDIGNLEKAIGDALTAGGIWSDDRLVDELVIRRYYDAPHRTQEWVEIVICLLA